jgi:hypothetical protein
MQQAEQLSKLKKHHEDEIAFLEKEVKEQEVGTRDSF